MPARAAVTLVATVIAVVLLFSFKTPAPTRARTAGADLTQSTPAPSDSAAPSGSASPSPSPAASAAGLKAGQYTGQDVLTKFGDVQVKVIISGGRINDVQPMQLPFDRSRSAEISQYAAPQLHDEVLQAQSAQIDTVSGATYTSDAYAQSVQAALDQAHA